MSLLRLKAEVMSMMAEPPPATVETWQHAMEVAMDAGVRPEVAHCHFGLARFYRATGDAGQARDHFATASTMYREMGMRFWLTQVEASA